MFCLRAFPVLFVHICIVVVVWSWTMAEGGPQDDQLAKLLDEVAKNPSNYKILTADEYDKLQTSTPKFGNIKFDFKSPGIGQSPRLKMMTDALKGQGQSSQGSTSILLPNMPPVNYPKLPSFSGGDTQQKGEVSYDVWSFEVRCLESSGEYPDHMIMQSMRNSLKGTARSMLVTLGKDATIQDMLTKLDGFYGNVSTSEILMQSFYSDCQKDDESIVAYGSRIEDTLVKAIGTGKMNVDRTAKDAMLRSKFWTGIRNQELKNSSRHHYDSGVDFQTLLREIRKIEQEEKAKVCLSSKQVPKSARQASNQVETDSTKEIMNQLSQLMSRLKSLEEKVSKPHFQAPQSYPEHAHQSSGYQPGFRGRGRYRGNRGGYGRRNGGRRPAPASSDDKVNQSDRPSNF